MQLELVFSNTQLAPMQGLEEEAVLAVAVGITSARIRRRGSLRSSLEGALEVLVGAWVGAWAEAPECVSSAAELLGAAVALVSASHCPMIFSVHQEDRYIIRCRWATESKLAHS